MRRQVVGRGVGAGLALMVLGGTAGLTAASAGAATSSGKESFVITTGPKFKEAVIAYGVVTAGGTDDASHDNYDVLHFANGTLRINHPDNLGHYSQHLDPATCFATYTITGSYTLSAGTGAYAGAKGKGHYKVTGAFLAAKTSSGACSQSAEPLAETSYITASGTYSG